MAVISVISQEFYASDARNVENQKFTQFSGSVHLLLCTK